MKSLLIADTTREEREQIVTESIGNIDGLCDGCSPGLLKMYQDYIDGHRELREINMEFNARYTSAMAGPGRSGCGYAEVSEQNYTGWIAQIIQHEMDHLEGIII